MNKRNPATREQIWQPWLKAIMAMGQSTDSAKNRKIPKNPLDIPLTLQYIPQLRCDTFFDN